MQKTIFDQVVCLIVLWSCLLAPAWGAAAPQSQGRAYLDFGVFAYEEGDYQDAVFNLEKALDTMEKDPYLHQYLGRSYLELKDYDKAETHLNTARGIDASITGLTYDLAMLRFETVAYDEAATLFAQAAREDSANVLALYYAGVSLFKSERFSEAPDYFIQAADASPSITANGCYYAGVSYYKTGQSQKALEMFDRVKATEKSGPLAESADKWIAAIQDKDQTGRPYNLYFKLGRRYDDNVQLEPSGLDLVTDQEDWATVGFFDGRYHFDLTGGFSVGAGYSHYQSFYDDLDEFNTTAALPVGYAQYAWNPLAFRLSYRPTYYWIDGDSYLREHRIEPEVSWRITDQALMRVLYRYDDKTYFDIDDLSGDSNELSVDVFYRLLEGRIKVFGGIGFEGYSAEADDQDYNRWQLKAGAFFTLPWKLELGLLAQYQDRKHDTDDRFFKVERDDDKYVGGISLSRPLYWDWLGIMAEYRYTRNDSNIKSFDYTRNLATISITASY